jgi:hypothetical protein
MQPHVLTQCSIYIPFCSNSVHVTEFSCGRFVVSLVLVHTLANGLGAAQFINAIADLARGLNMPTVAPMGSGYNPEPTQVTSRATTIAVNLWLSTFRR